MSTSHSQLPADLNAARAAYEAAGASLTDWSEQPKAERDWKKLFLITGLAILSWVATYVGMLELIEANMGELPIVHKIIIGFSVAMLMTMVVWLLDQLFAPIGFFTKLCYGAGYVFLTVISVGFGFGFYWKVLESKSEGTRGAETAISQVQAPLQTAAARLEGLGRTLDSLQQTSAQKAEVERTQGTSCPNSKPGDGPRRKLRDDDAARFAFARDVVKGRIETVKTDIAAIDADLIKIVKNDTSIVDKHGTRNEFMKGVGRKLDNTVTQFNAFKGDPQLKQIRNELAERADKTQFVDTQGKPYSCPDQGLATMIRSVVASIDALPTLERPKINTVEGSDATVEAFRRLIATFYGALAFKLPPSADDLREMQKKAVATMEGAKPAPVVSLEQAGLSKRDYIPLAIAIFVDICLLLVSMGRPMNRLGNLVPKMQEAERGPVIQILSRFNEIHRDRQIRENFEIFRHVVFDMNGDYYVAVPLDAPPRMNPKDRETLRLEAQLLSNLFTSFEKEKIFTRVLMPLISTKQIQKRLWKQGSKFSQSESYRLYKFKDGAWSEIILGAIMGAAKRVEAEKRRRRIEDDVFSRHEPRFTGATSTAATDAATGAFPSPQPIEQPLTHAPARSAPVPHWMTPANNSGMTAPADAQQTPMHAVGGAARSYAGVQSQMQQGFGPYASAAAAQYGEPRRTDASVTPYPMASAQNHVPPAARRPDAASDTVADLNDYRQKLEQQTDVSVRAQGPGPSDIDLSNVITLNPPTQVIEPSSVVEQTIVMPPAPQYRATSETRDGVTVEALERKVVYHLPAGDTTTIPASLAALIGKRDLAATTAEATNNSLTVTEKPILRIEQARAIDDTSDEALEPTDLPWLDNARDDTPTIAGRFAPSPRQS